MRSERTTYGALRRRLLARASALALRVALRPRGWAPGLLAVGLISAQAPALAQEVIDLATEADVEIQGANAYDRSERSGSSVSGAGDVDGDGIDDLIIGAPDARRSSANCPTDPGASYVVFGSDEAFPRTVDLADLGDGGDGFVLRGSSFHDKCSGERSGSSVSGAGDVNGDGLDDLIVGAPNNSDNGVGYVVFGKEDRPSASVGFDDFFPGDGSEGFVLFGAYNAFGSPSVHTGASVGGAGDVNGDGFDDLIIGAPRIDARGDYSFSGASYVVFGTDQGFPARVFLDGLNGSDGFTLQGAEPNGGFGTSVSAAGDVNDDGIDDLIIGAPDADSNGRTNAGVSYVVLGTEDGFPPTIDVATDADLTILGAAASDRSGGSVSGTGDINDDGVDDLIIGAFGASPNGRDLAGASYVVFGADEGFPAVIDLATDADVAILGAAEGDRSGRSVSEAGDADGDGIDDLIVGAAGASYVIFGSARDLPATIDLATDADVVIQGAAAGDSAGRSVSGALDINDDGGDDLIIGAPGAAPNGRAEAGASYVVFGTPAEPAAAIDDLIADVEAAGLDPRIDKILTKTLSAALDNLNKGRERGAIIALRLFVIEVKAFRGKKIFEADADEWIADAEAIIDTLKAQRDRHRGPNHDAPSPMVEAQE